MSGDGHDGTALLGSAEGSLSAEFRRRLESPLEQSTALPNAAYIDPSFLRLVLSPYWDGATRQFDRLIANAMT